MEYNITSMIIMDPNSDHKLRYNIFDKNYKYITSISCNTKEEFDVLFNNFKSTNSYEVLSGVH